MQPPFFYVPPSHDNTASNSVIKLAGTGTTESTHVRALVPDKGHILVVGAAPVYVSFRLNRLSSGAVDPATALRLPANIAFPFRPIKNVKGKTGSVFVSVEAADGAAAYTVDIWQAE